MFEIFDFLILFCYCWNIVLLQLQQQMLKQQKQSYEMWPQMYQMRTGQDAWPVQPNPTRIAGSGGRAAVLASGGGGAAAKRGCAGTGVFLPRRYANNNDCNAYASDSRKKSGIFRLSIFPFYLI